MQNEWKPIETAPKDRPILAADDQGIEIVNFDKYRNEFVMNGFDEHGDVIGMYPTHWQPLPQPPEGE